MKVTRLNRLTRLMMLTRPIRLAGLIKLTRFMSLTRLTSRISRLQDKDSLMDCQGALEEPEGRPGGPGNLKTARGFPP